MRSTSLSCFEIWVLLFWQRRISDEHLSKDDFRSARSTVAMKDYPVIDVPAFIGDIRKIPAAVIRKKERSWLFV